jgi:2-polyprenyl-3-methyl-5-hydroxy-6-metoxy-1,4-benzoquinol methylase
MQCIVCGDEMNKRINNWNYYCKSCGYWKNDVKVSHNQITNGNNSDSDHTNISNLDPIRISNFINILDSLSMLDKSLKTILDVGCATGVFINVANEYGFTCTGIEPNKIMYDAAKKNSNSVICGFFPDAIDVNSKFDVIIFNDVLEHIEDLDQILNGCKKHLSNNGVIVVNLPNSNGVLFKIAKFLSNLKIHGPWKRLWQTMFYTPHVHYFNPKSLNKYMDIHAFKSLSDPIKLRSFSVNSLWGRLRADKSMGLLKTTFYFFSLKITSKIINLFESDTFYVIYGKKE